MNPIDPARSARAPEALLRAPSAKAGDPLASYSFDMLAGLTRMLERPRYAFLAYLIGMAAEEAYRLAEEAEKRRSAGPPETTPS